MLSPGKLDIKYLNDCAKNSFLATAGQPLNLNHLERKSEAGVRVKRRLHSGTRVRALRLEQLDLHEGHCSMLPLAPADPKD